MLRLLRGFLRPLTFKENNLNSIVIWDIECFKDEIFTLCSTYIKQNSAKI